jgi:hypothetical protein
LEAPRKLWFLIPLLVAAPLPGSGQEPEATEVGSGPVHVLGFVSDLDTGAPLSGARVELLEIRGSGVSIRSTEDQGTFQFRSIRSQSYGIRITHPGYKEVEIRLETREGEEVRVQVEMVRTVVALEPIVVTATRQSHLRRVGFLDRRDGGMGQFMTRAEIDARNPFHVSDIFRTLSGFRVTPGGRGSGNLVLGRGNCPPAFFLDGTRLLEGSSIDEILRPDALEALEVYHASQTPPQFRGSRCGAVVAWTRVPDPSEGGRPLTWRRILLGLGFIALAITATSL